LSGRPSDLKPVPFTLGDTVCDYSPPIKLRGSRRCVLRDWLARFHDRFFHGRCDFYRMHSLLEIPLILEPFLRSSTRFENWADECTVPLVLLLVNESPAS